MHSWSVVAQHKQACTFGQQALTPKVTHIPVDNTSVIGVGTPILEHIAPRNTRSSVPSRQKRDRRGR
eukprot:5972619-Amphidinium_carterae.1